MVYYKKSEQMASKKKKDEQRRLEISLVIQQDILQVSENHFLH